MKPGECTNPYGPDDDSESRVVGGEPRRIDGRSFGIVTIGLVEAPDLDVDDLDALLGDGAAQQYRSIQAIRLRQRQLAAERLGSFVPDAADVCAEGAVQ